MATDQGMMCYKPASYYNYAAVRGDTNSEAHPSALFMPQGVNIKFKLEEKAL